MYIVMLTSPYTPFIGDGIFIVIAITLAFIGLLLQHSGMPKRGNLVVKDRLFLRRNLIVWGQNEFEFTNKGNAPIKSVVLCFNRKPVNISWSPTQPKYTVLEAEDGYSIVIHSIPKKSSILFFSYGEQSQLLYVLKDKKCSELGSASFYL